MPFELLRDTGSATAIMASHTPSEHNQRWPSDHGIEALSVRCQLMCAATPPHM